MDALVVLSMKLKHEKSCVHCEKCHVDVGGEGEMEGFEFLRSAGIKPA